MAEPGSPTLQALLFVQQEELFPGSPPSPAPPLGLLEQAGGSKKGPEMWASSGLDDSEPESLLGATVDPNAVYSAGSDSGISEEPGTHSPPPFCTGPCPQRQPLPAAGVAIPVGDWLPPLLIPDTCMVNELLAAQPGAVPAVLGPGDRQAAVPAQQFPALFLTEEEQRLLSQEGVALPSNLPLTKVEERLLKKVRRKIRNKQSAQDSRRRKKEYVDGLESRVATCAAQNQELQQKVQELEKHNMSLLGQLQKLQELIKPTSSKAAQTSTCVLILLVSLALLLFPSYSPLRRGARGSPGSYTPTGVISRNILTQREFSEVVEAPGSQDLQATEPGPIPGEQPGPQVAGENRAEGADGGPAPLGTGSQKKGANASAQAHPQQQEPPMGLPHGKGAGASGDAAKLVHADEM